ncbi:MAG TPA: ribosome small subunit-dependent GTPase A, partial [Bacillota bacterium]
PGAGYIETIVPRTTELRKPPVANVDQAAIVFTLRDPDKNLALVDRFLVMVERKGLGIILCLNKCDLLSEEEIAEAVRYYEGSGYRIIPTSAKWSVNLETLRETFAGRTTVLAGQSGVGKSTLLNALIPGAGLSTGELSRKVGRGTHTTRNVRLLRAWGGLVADTPGFTQVELEGLPVRGLADLFPEFRPCEGYCRFDGCLHDREPGCAVKEAVAEGRIDGQRYQHYLEFLSEAREAERNRY